MPKISVIVPVYNTGKYLAECLDSIIAQTFCDIEIICVNDGSTDDSQQILQKYAMTDNRIILIEQKNSGVVTARNNGIRHATSDLIFALDSDDIIMPDCLEKLYKKITTTKYRVVACNVLLFNEGISFFEQPKFTKFAMYGLHENCVVSALFYKSDFEKFGGYCTDFNGYGGDDMDYWLNYIDANMPMYRLSEVLFLYRKKPDTERVWRNYSKNEYEQRKQYKNSLLLKRHPKIRIYEYLYNFMHRKIPRFFYRKQNGYIKIFKIPIYRYIRANLSNAKKYLESVKK